MRVRWKVIIPVLGPIATWLASPHVLAIVSEETAHYLLAASALILAITPALVTNRPKTNRKALRTSQRIEERLHKAGLDEPPPTGGA